MSSKRRGARPTHPSGRPFRSVASQLSADHVEAIEQACLAELSGDWAAAFTHHRSVPMFAESLHGSRLAVLARLGADAPQWLVTRMIAAVAQRDTVGRPGHRPRGSIEFVVPLLYPHGVPFEQMDCEHPEQIVPEIAGRDWVLRQFDLYDRGGLRALGAMPEAQGALSQTPFLDDWATARMGGYRIVGAADDVLTLADARTHEEIEVLDLGLTAQHAPGVHVLGRIVPGDTPTGRLLDTAPLPVDARTARAVATHPNAWLAVLAERTRTGTLAPAFSHLPETSLSSDLPRYAWTSLLGHPLGEELPRSPGSMVAEALKVALALAEDPPALERRRHLVGELLLDDLLDDRVTTRFATAAQAAAWRTLSASLPAAARPVAEHAAWLAEACPADADLAG